MKRNDETPVLEVFSDFISKAFKAAVDQDWLRSHHLGITAVPTFRMNEENLVGAQPYEQLAAFVSAQRVPPRNAPAPPQG
jgi:predicted DsbA family dithiol-disulfide isomerase